MYNADKFDYWPIFEAIKTYYPLGLDKEFSLQFKHPASEKISKLIVDNIHGDDNPSQWNSFFNNLKNELGHEIVSTIDRQLPCFSASVLLDTKKSDDLTRTKELNFFISVLGPFFSIIGKDGSHIEYQENRNYWITNYYTVSPEREYADLFKLLELKIKETFKDYRLVPFNILKQKPEGLYSRWYEFEEMTVFNALFNNEIILPANIAGDEYYGSDLWIKEGYAGDPGWTVYP